jgi:hypothetical protein
MARGGRVGCGEREQKWEGLAWERHNWLRACGHFASGAPRTGARPRTLCCVHIDTRTQAPTQQHPPGAAVEKNSEQMRHATTYNKAAIAWIMTRHSGALTTAAAAVEEALR